MASNRPTVLPHWTQGLPGQVAQPPQSLRDTGFTAGQAPAAEHVNQLFYELGNWVNFLDDAQGSTSLVGTLDTSVRLIGGGQLGYTASSATWTWSQPFYLAMPSVPNADNALSPGSAVIPQGSVAYVQANVPFSTSGDVTSGSTQVPNIAYEMPITQGQTVTGQGIPQGTTVQAIAGSTVTLSQAATATAAQTTLTFAGTGALSVQVAPIATLVPNANTIVIAYGMGSHLFVGVNAHVTVLHDGEQKTLMEPGYFGIIRAPAGQPLIARQAVYISQDTSGTRTQGAAYPADSSAQNGLNRCNVAGFVISSVDSGQTATVMTGGILPGFGSLVAGAAYYLDPANVGGIIGSKPAIATTPYIVRVGQALSQTTLLARPEHLAEGVFPSVSTQALTVTQSTVLPDGTQALPGIAFSTNTATGVWHNNTGTASQEAVSVVLGGQPLVSLTTVGTILQAPTGGIPLLVNNSAGTLVGTITATGVVNFPSIVSQQGFRNTIGAGFLSNVSVSTGSFLISGNGMQLLVPVTKSGSVLTVFIAGQTNTNSVNVDVYKNGSLIWANAAGQGLSGTSGSFGGQVRAIGQANRNQYSVTAGDVLQLLARGSAQGAAATATNVYLQGFITIEEGA
jgi:hypothetical protein